MAADVQFAKKIGATSLLNVGAAALLRERLWGDIQSAQRDERRNDKFPHNWS